MRANLWLACGLAAVCGCAPIKAPTTEPSDAVPPPAGPTPLPLPSLAPMTLKEAVVRVASVECAFETLEDDYKRASAMIEAASADELSVVYIDLVRRDDTRHCVSRIGRWAGKLPFSTALLDAFRERRDGFVEDRGNLLATFEYCEKFGGTSDLKWMQATVEKFGKDYPRWEADEAIKKLRRRLAEQEQGQ